MSFADLLEDASGQLTISVQDRVATVELTRPERRNAMSYAMWRAFARLMPALGAAEAVDVVVLRGSPGGPFSAGADISEFAQLRSTPATAAGYGQAVESAERAILELPKPSIAMIAGFAVGGGTQLAAACDLRIADTSSRFGVTPATLGIVYALPSTARLVEIVGSSWASYLLLTGELVDAPTALRIGLVHEVHPPEMVATRTTRLAGTLASRARISQQGAKELIARCTAGQQDLDDEVRALYAASLNGPEYAEGVAAFLAKRQPDFRAARARQRP